MSNTSDTADQIELTPAADAAAADEPLTEAEARTAAQAARQAQVDAHFDRISTLLGRAELLASEMLHGLTRRVRSNATVYPGELIQLCRGLHWLAKCNQELRKHLQLAAREEQAADSLTAERIDQLEARLRPLFEQRAA
jgi:hypothetical protein